MVGGVISTVGGAETWHQRLCPANTSEQVQILEYKRMCLRFPVSCVQSLHGKSQVHEHK